MMAMSASPARALQEPNMLKTERKTAQRNAAAGKRRGFAHRRRVVVLLFLPACRFMILRSLTA